MEGKRKQSMKFQDLLTVQGAADRLSVSRNTIRAWCNTGELFCYYVGPRKDRRIPRTEVEDYLERHRENGG